PDIARLAALRGGGSVASALDAIVLRMAEAAGDLPALQILALEFWSALVDGTANVAYRLAHNSLRQTYEKSMDVLTTVPADELADRRSYAAIAASVRRGDARTAERLARTLTRRGETRLLAALAALGESAPRKPARASGGRA